jgi:hypothetical protein
MENGRAFDANAQWFRMNLLRHTGFMVPEDVADAVVAAVTLPRGHQYRFMEVTPSAPIGALPPTFEKWGAALAAEFAPERPRARGSAVRAEDGAQLIRHACQRP